MSWYLLQIIICFSLLSAAVFGQDSAVYQPEQMHADLRKFRSALEYAHPDLYANVTPEEFSRLFQSLIQQSSAPLKPVQFHNLVLQLVAGLHDGHTTVQPTKAFRTDLYQQKLLPFHVMVQNERTFLIRNMSGKEIADGSEILSIDNNLSNKIISEFKLHFAGDGFCESCLDYRFGSSYHSFYRSYAWIFGSRPSNNFAIRDRNTGKILEIDLAGISGSEFREREKKKYGNNLHTSSLEETLAKPVIITNIDRKNRFAYLKINRFFKDSFDEPANTFPDLYKEAFRQIKNSGIKTLIIDLRDNGGGIGGNAAHLIRYLSGNPFIPTREMSLRGNDEYYAKITNEILDLDRYFGLKKSSDGRYLVTETKDLSELREFQPETDHQFRGRIYVLTNGGTVSAAAAAAGMLRENTSAVFVGQETGGYAGMSNGIRQLTIRGDATDVSINFPLIHSDFNVHKSVKGRGVVPDHFVESSVSDVISGRDAILDFVLDRIRKEKR